MRNIFRKAMTVLGSAALVGATVGVAAAASYPEPFTSNTAIVVGANAAPSDSVAAASIASDLDAASAGSSVGGTTTVTGGDSYKFEKTSTKFHLGDAITSVVSSNLDEDDMPVLLNDGVYVDDDNDEFDFTQEIAIDSGLTLTLFEDNDYKEDTPSLGFDISPSADILTYTMTFSDEPLISDMATTDLMLMGKEYYVLSAAYNSLTLLDAATDTVLAEGETASITAGGKTYTVSINFVSELEAKLTVNGENTNSLSEGETYKLDDGSYVGLKDILYTAKDTGVSKVEFSIGSGKLVLTSGSEVELNEENVDSVTATIVNNSLSMTSIAIDWDADDDLFITEDSTIVLPGFESVQLAFGGLDLPVEEEINIVNDGNDGLMLDNFPFKDSDEDVALLYGNGTAFVGIGKDATHLLLTDDNADGNITFDDDSHDYFVVSWADARDGESYLMRAANFKVDNTINKTTFQYRKDGAWVDAKSDRKEGDTFSMGNAELFVGAINKVGKSVVVDAYNAGTSFNKLYSAEGLTVYLPFNATTGTGAINLNFTSLVTSYGLLFEEEDKDGDLEDGQTITVTLGFNTQSPLEVEVDSWGSSGSSSSEFEVGDTDKYLAYLYGDLATRVEFDKSGDQDTLMLTYFGDEVAADVYITSSDAVVSSGSGESGVMTVKDTEVSTVASKNLIVVGGSAINSVAADLLGGAYRGEQFTSMTGVGDGEFLIQSFSRSGNTALLVAGYNAADTTKAATYLTNNDVDTAVGMKYEGTSATEASLVVA